MPNLKMFVGDAVDGASRAKLHADLPRIRDLLCKTLLVDIPLAQFAIVPVLGLADQAQIAIEIQILPKAERTREQILTMCEMLRNEVQRSVDVKVAIRVTTVDPADYVVFR